MDECSLGEYSLQVERVEAFGEPSKDRSYEIVGLLWLSLIAPQARHAHRCAQLPGLCLLSTRDRKRALEIRLRFRRIRHRRHKRDFTGNAIDLGFAPPFFACFDRRQGFTDAAPSIIELTKFCVRPRQICQVERYLHGSPPLTSIP